MVTGPYDLIAAIESQTTDDLLDLITREIRYIDGVTDTITCFVIPQKPKQ
jgi:DNA-binding Lrp family transcriptional regulator